MHTSELAALAGVTIRTLRHYHQVGLLEEPGRTADDYCEYDVRHLARLLLIIRLTELGVPLAVLPEVLDDPDAAADLLDRLDEEATAGIQRLTSRRAVITVLRQHYAVPDLSPTDGVAPDLVRYEREQLALFGHLVGEAQTAALTRTLTRLAPLTPGSAELLRRFAALGPDAADGDVERLAAEMTQRYRPLLDALPDVETGPGRGDAPALAANAEQPDPERPDPERPDPVQPDPEQPYNEQQVRVLRAFEERVRGA